MATTSSLAKKGITHSRAFATTMSIWVWAGWWWMWVQLVFAFISLFFLAIAFGIRENSIGRAFDDIFGLVFSVMPTEFALGIFVILWFVVIAIGWGTLIGMVIQYTTALLHPLGGTGSAFKYLTFLLALIGYATPFLNLFPWFFLYTLIVLRYPK